ncbi:hypothetical protein [Nonomuraea jiangxiensis]|uniref:Uncharacterized protein n=1 Tax=Nonomuraea jiangxiensis TaxID=633440 RepID=A0A1G8LF86_9ACTN|nr:hypothetical protein [Nonomuraea jiangxiensis]SDI54358.1 hypothetical protein SAMN05421869_10677 [Nonomuraea jiangxiensis]
MGKAALRILGFEVKGLAAVGLWLARRRHGVPPGATAVTYAKEQYFTMSLMMFAMVVEAVVVDLLLVAMSAPAGVRYAVLVLDVYGLLFGLALVAACVTRPHVVTADEVRIRYGAYLDVRVPRHLIASVHTSRSYHERAMIAVADGRLTVAVASTANVTIRLTEPITFERPLGAVAEAHTIRFFADRPEILVTALRAEDAVRP